MVAQDIVSYFQAQWDNTNTSGVTPIIAYDIMTDDTETGDGAIPGHYNRGLFFKNISDEIDEIGLRRTHHDAESEDVYECKCVDFSKQKCEEIRDEVRRICRLVLTDEEHSWLDWSGGRWDQESPRTRKVFMMNIFFSKAGIPF